MPLQRDSLVCFDFLSDVVPECGVERVGRAEGLVEE